MGFLPPQMLLRISKYCNGGYLNQSERPGVVLSRLHKCMAQANVNRLLDAFHSEAVKPENYLCNPVEQRAANILESEPDKEGNKAEFI